VRRHGERRTNREERRAGARQGAPGDGQGARRARAARARHPPVRLGGAFHLDAARPCDELRPPENARRPRRSGQGGALRIAARLAPPPIDAGEITDKGSINQRAVLRHRAESVEALYVGGPDVISLDS